MRIPVRGAAALAAVALSATPFAGTSTAREIPSADGCIRSFAATRYYLPGGSVTVGPPIVIDPRPAQSVVQQVANSTYVLVSCLV